MGVTEDFREFASIYHKNNGTHNPLDDRYIQVGFIDRLSPAPRCRLCICCRRSPCCCSFEHPSRFLPPEPPQSHKRIVYYDQEEKKFVWKFQLCLGDLPEDHIREQIAEPIVKHQFKLNLMNETPTNNPWLRISIGRDTLYPVVNIHSKLRCHKEIKLKNSGWGKCMCRVSNGNLCDNHRYWNSDYWITLPRNSVYGLNVYVQPSYDCWTAVNDKDCQKFPCCKTHWNSYTKKGSDMEGAWIRLLYDHNYKVNKHGYVIKRS
jgi:hypothetical protein